ncbi:recombinase family protein [Salmonella enterica subsp. enterica serovar Bredeney]|nr:recombinase family protein [Salmonella enterica subsp. enterica serovar Bredeney]
MIFALKPYVYIRVSSADQNTARQEEALLKAGFQPDKIYVEHVSAKDANRPELQKLLEQLRPVDERYSYFSEGANQMMIPNYGEMRRYGEPVSTAFVESTINEVIARRMAKKQQMQWSREGAHYLLQTRTAVLNNELQDKFASWYPGCMIDAQSEGELSAMAA